MKAGTILGLVGLCIVGATVAAPVIADSSAEADKLFAKNCATCHGKDGRAKTFRAKFNQARDLTDAQWQDAVADAAIIESIKSGRDKMPGFAKKLSEAQVELLLQYVRSLKQSSSAPASQALPEAQPPGQPDP